ncbi:MAG: NAD(P)-binding domain-containing protein [Bacteroidales bacterium]|nr:NAD(P)-binding domain-containing protein [Bacteroidales bacterium]
MKTTTLGFIGGGRITRIFLQAFQNKSLEFNSILVYEPNQEVASSLKAQFPEITIAGSLAEPAQQDLVFLAVHPPVMMETLNQIKESLKAESSLISLAPKITIEKIAGLLHTQRIVRMIPNASSYINKGYNPVCFHKDYSEEEKKNLMQLFRKLGKTVEVEESLLEGYAMVSAMLPTYFWFQWKKMEELAVQMGFDEAEAKKVIRNTLKRSIQLYYKSSLTPEEVMDLIPVRPIGEHEDEIKEIYDKRISGLYEKIRP